MRPLGRRSRCTRPPSIRALKVTSAVCDTVTLVQEISWYDRRSTDGCWSSAGETPAALPWRCRARGSFLCLHHLHRFVPFDHFLVFLVWQSQRWCRRCRSPACAEALDDFDAPAVSGGVVSALAGVVQALLPRSVFDPISPYVMRVAAALPSDRLLVSLLRRLRCARSA